MKDLKSLIEEGRKLDKKRLGWTWEIEKHTPADKKFWIEPSIAMIDYDDVDHEKQDSTAEFIVFAANNFKPLLDAAEKWEGAQKKAQAWDRIVMYITERKYLTEVEADFDWFFNLIKIISEMFGLPIPDEAKDD